MGPSARVWGALKTGFIEGSQRPPALAWPSPAYPAPRAPSQIWRTQDSLCWGAKVGGSGKASREWTQAGGRPGDQQVFSGRGGVWSTSQCRVALRLCYLLRPPLCVCRKYLRDADRQVLAQRAFILTVKVLEDTLSELAEVCPRLLSSPRRSPWPFT